MRIRGNRISLMLLCFFCLIFSGCKKKEQETGSSNYVVQKIILSEPAKDTKEAEETFKEAAKSSDTISIPDLFLSYPDFYKNGISQDPISIPKNLGSVFHVSPIEVVDKKSEEIINAKKATDIIEMPTVNAATLSACFFSQEITNDIFNRIENKSYSEGCTITLSSLRYIRVLHYGFDGKIHVGELIVNYRIADDVIEIFKQLFDVKYPIEQMVLVDEYGADDEKSMEANNTSCFNYRIVEGTAKLSNHAYGLAIDINPLYNPYIRESNEGTKITPVNGVEYADRTRDCRYYIKKDDVIYQLFKSHGFTWGGDWEKSKDYQHFQKVFK